MTFLHPIWLLLAIPVAASLLLWRIPSRFVLALRIGLLLLLLLALAGLAVYLPARAGTIVVVADRSRSMPQGSDTLHKEAIAILQGGMAADERLAVLSFGRNVAVERSGQSGPFNGFVHAVDGNASNLADALEEALALIPRDSPGKVLILSDGRWTGRDPAAAAARAVGRGIAFDFRPLQRSAANDLAITRVDAPGAVGPNEAFLITAWVQAPQRQEVAYELLRGNQRLARGVRTLESGLNRLTFRDQAGRPGSLAYRLTVTASGENQPEDPVPENNSARFLVGVEGTRPVLLVTSAKNSGLARLLRGGGLEVATAPPEACRWSLEDLARFRAVLLENIPADKMGSAGMEMLSAWVRETGAGLMMTGGRNSYAPGGYFRSPLEPVLPLSMELRNEHRKLAMAIVVALDRSGSMAMPVGGGRVKMDLANLGTVQVLDLLSPMDEFGVLAIDTVPHVIKDIGPVTDRERVRGDILRIQSMGGGIYVYVALEAAYNMLAEAKSLNRHIILFADAADAEEPGRYEELIDRCEKQNITVSVIGLGKETDKDGALLQDIARRGKGRCFFSDSPEDLPRLFAQDTFVVARSSFLDEVTPLRALPGLKVLTGREFQTPQQIGGYNLCYLRPGANLAAVSVDEYEAPLVAAWQAGLGRVLCYTGEADGQYTGPIARWSDVGAFFTSLTRWTAGDKTRLSDGMLLTQDVKNGVARVQLHLDPRRKADPFTGLPRLTTLRAEGMAKPRTEQSALHWLDADTLAADVALDGTETALATVAIPGQQPVSLPPVCLPYSPEYKPAAAGSGVAALERLARATGGKERLDLAGLWAEFPRQPRLVELGPWLLLAAVLLLLLEVLERRTVLLTSWGQRVGRLVPERIRVPARRKSGKVSPAALPRPEEEAPPMPEPSREAGLLDALRKARERTRGKGPPASE